MGSTKVTDEKLQVVLDAIAPCTLPLDAYGGELHWHPPGERPAVWAWISWPHRPAERIPAIVHASNDRVCVVAWYTPMGERNTVVWRNAVTRRSDRPTSDPQS